MKEMNIEKRILKGQQVDEVIEVSANANLTYKKDSSGIHTMGPIRVQGAFMANDELKHFEETLEMDILAPLSKLSGEPFEIKVTDVTGIADDGIMLYIDLMIDGLRDGTKEEVAPKPIPEEVVPVKNEQSTSNKKDKTEDVEGNQRVWEPEIECIEDLFDDANNVYTSCRLIVAKEQDTYESIAARYGVNADELMKVNKNKLIEAKVLIMLP